MGGVVPGVAERTDLAFEGNWVPLGCTGLAIVVSIEVRFLGRTGALTGLLVECEVFRTSHAFLIGEIPSCRFGTGNASTSTVVVVLALAFAFLGGGVPSGVGGTGLALIVGSIPFAIASLTNVIGIKIRLILRTGTLRGFLVEGESLWASHAFLVLEVPSCRSRTLDAFAGPVIVKLTLALALFCLRIEGLVILAGNAVASAVGIGFVRRTDAIKGGFVPDFAVGAVGRERKGRD